MHILSQEYPGACWQSCDPDPGPNRNIYASQNIYCFAVMGVQTPTKQRNGPGLVEQGTTRFLPDKQSHSSQVTLVPDRH